MALTPVICWQTMSTMEMMARLRFPGMRNISLSRVLAVASPVNRLSISSWLAMSWISLETYSESAGRLRCVSGCRRPRAGHWRIHTIAA